MVEAEAGQRRVQERGGTDQGEPAAVSQRPPVGGADRPQAGGVEAGQPGDVEDPSVAVGLQQGGDGVVEDVRGVAVELSGQLEVGADEVDSNDEGRGGLRRRIRPKKGAGGGHGSTSVQEREVCVQVWYLTVLPARQWSTVFHLVTERTGTVAVDNWRGLGRAGDGWPALG
jgi:hypothetical protein